MIGLPPHRIWDYDFSYDREIRPGDPPNQEGYARDEVEGIMHRTTRTDYLASQFVYPITVKDIELEGAFRVTIRGAFTVRAFDPYTPVIILRGEWFAKVRAAIEGILINALRGKKIDDFLAADKVGTPGTISTPGTFAHLEEAILEAMKLDTSVRRTSGMEVISFDFKGYSVGKPAEQTALEAKKIAELKGDADIAEKERAGKAKAVQALGEKQALITLAEGNKQAAILEAEGKKQALDLVGNQQAEIYTKQGAALNTSPAMATVAANEAFGSGLKGVSTVFFPGANATPLVNLNPPPQPTPVPPPTHAPEPPQASAPAQPPAPAPPSKSGRPKAQRPNST